MASNERLKQLQDLQQFGGECQQSVQSLLDELNWSSNEVLNCEPMVSCPLDSSHRMSRQSLPKHMQICSQLKSTGVTNDPNWALASSSAFYYRHCPQIRPVIVIDKQTEDKILAIQQIFRDILIKTQMLDPFFEFKDKMIGYCLHTEFSVQKQVFLSQKGEPIGDGIGDRSRIELSTEQRLALYSHVIHTKDESMNVCSKQSADKEALSQSLSIDLFSCVANKSDQHNSQCIGGVQQPAVADIKLLAMAKNRDLKRKRLSYRSSPKTTTNVHTRGRTYTEILAKVIENHCQTLSTTTIVDRTSDANTSQQSSSSTSSRQQIRHKEETTRRKTNDSTKHHRSNNKSQHKYSKYRHKSKSK